VKAADENFDVQKLAEYLRMRSLPSDYIKVFLAFWTKESEKVIDLLYDLYEICNCCTTYNKQIGKSVLKDATWNNSVDHFAWRVDVKAMSRNVSEINEPVAFFEHIFKKGHQFDDSTSSTAKFEMDRTQVSEMLKNLTEIQRKIEEAR
jgi:hypothetical protein